MSKTPLEQDLKLDHDSFLLLNPRAAAHTNSANIPTYPHTIVPLCSLSCSQESASNPRHEPDQSIQ